MQIFDEFGSILSANQHRGKEIIKNQQKLREKG
jgi:hypothetical protein